MLTMHRASKLGADVVQPSVYAGMVLVSAGTCLVAPPALSHLLRRSKT